MAEGDAARLVVSGERKRVCGGTGGYEENRDLAFENLAEALRDCFVEIAVAIGRSKAGIVRIECGGNLGMGTGPVVGGKKHAFRAHFLEIRGRREP